MATYAYCQRCKRYHKRGTKIFQEHKDWLGMYLESLPKVPTHIKEYQKLRGRRGGNPMARKKTRRPRQTKILGIPVITVAIIGGLVYWLTKKQ